MTKIAFWFSICEKKDSDILDHFLKITVSQAQFVWDYLKFKYLFGPLYLNLQKWWIWVHHSWCIFRMPNPNRIQIFQLNDTYQNNLLGLVKRLLSWDFYQKSVTVREFLVFHTVSQTNFSKKICEINRKFIMLQNALYVILILRKY